MNKNLFKPALLSLAVSSALYSGLASAQDTSKTAEN